MRGRRYLAEEEEEREFALPWGHEASPCSVAPPRPRPPCAPALRAGFWFSTANFACRATREMRCCFGDSAAAGASWGAVWGRALAWGGLGARGVAVMSKPAALRRPGPRGRGGGAMVVTERVRRGLVLARGAAGARARCREVFTVLAKVVGLLVLVEEVVAGLVVMVLVLEVVEVGTTVDELLVQGAVTGLVVPVELALDTGALAATGAGVALLAATEPAGCLPGALGAACAGALLVLVVGGAGLAVVTVMECGVDLVVVVVVLVGLGVVARQEVLGPLLLSTLTLDFRFRVWATGAASSDFLI